MTPHFCTSRHAPDEGVYGDCLRAVVASYFDVEPATVPHFAQLAQGDDTISDSIFREYLLRVHNVRPFVVAVDTELPGLLAVQKELNTDITYLLLCSYGGDHVVLCRNDKIIHDPASRDGYLRMPDGPLSNGFYVVIVFVEDK